MSNIYFLNKDYTIASKYKATPFGSANIFKQPFRHSITTGYKNDDGLKKLISWLKEYNGWKRSETDFYDQWELKFKPEQQINNIPFICEANLKKIMKHLINIYDKDFHPFITISAHRLDDSQGIGIHTDKPLALRETHRLLVQLNDDWKIDNGGQLLFFDKNKLDSVFTIITPEYGTIVDFECTSNSFHAVSNVKNAQRYTLVISAWEKDKLQPLDYPNSVWKEEGCSLFQVNI